MNPNPNYIPNEEEALEIIDAMASRGILSQTSKQAANRGVKGGAIMPQMMGGAVAKRVKPGAINAYWIIDESGSLFTLRHVMIEKMKQTLAVLKAEQARDEVDYTINLGVVAFNTQARIILMPTPVNDVDPSLFDNYMPSGWTALNDSWMAALVGDAGYNFKLFASGAKARMTQMTLFTDTWENDSKVYQSVNGNPPSEISVLMADLRKGRDHVFVAINFGGDRQYLLKMGFLDRNIVDLADFSDATITEAYRVSSQAVVVLSQKVSSGGTNAVPKEDPSTQFDNAMFT